jgi:hypothetical protein
MYITHTHKENFPPILERVPFLELPHCTCASFLPSTETQFVRTQLLLQKFPNPQFCIHHCPCKFQKPWNPSKMTQTQSRQSSKDDEEDEEEEEEEEEDDDEEE